MNVILGDGICFIHIPKTAGLAIRDGYWKGAYSKRYWGRMPPLYKWAFAVVRNPYDRLVSGAAYCDVTIPEAIRILDDVSIGYGVHDNFAKHHLLPMTHPYNCIQFADRIIRFESLQRGWKRICRMAGWPQAPLEHRNASKHKHYREVITPKQKVEIDRIFKYDFKRFNYDW